MTVGKPATFEGHTLVFRGTKTVNSSGRSSLVATVDLDGHAYYPAIEQFALSNDAVVSPAVRSTPAQDIYLTWRACPLPDGPRAGVGVYVEPLVMWLWVGGLVVVLGALLVAVALGPSPRRSRRRTARGATAEDAACRLWEPVDGARTGRRSTCLSRGRQESEPLYERRLRPTRLGRRGTEPSASEAAPASAVGPCSGRPLVAGAVWRSSLRCSQVPSPPPRSSANSPLLGNTRTRISGPGLAGGHYSLGAVPPRVGAGQLHGDVVRAVPARDAPAPEVRQTARQGRGRHRADGRVRPDERRRS